MRQYNIEKISQQILRLFGQVNFLQVYCKEGDLVGALLKEGIDAFGIDCSELAIDRANRLFPGRFNCGNLDGLSNNMFDCLIFLNQIEWINPFELDRTINNIFRVAKRYVFLRISSKDELGDAFGIGQRKRAWWENKFFAYGFRKSVTYYQINDYEALNYDELEQNIVIALEKIPPAACNNYPVDRLLEERDLHMDMLRETGECSDAHIIRYDWALNYIKPGDRVLDAACGLGYGSYIVKARSYAQSVLGVDGSAYAINYAKTCFIDKGLDYTEGMLPEALQQIEDGSFDVVISFETLEHVENPEYLLAEFYRLLTPGGRIIVSAPNDWSDETGEDPNPYHLHVYDWDKLKNQLEKLFILENGVGQTASQFKVNGKWQPQNRQWVNIDILSDKPPINCEWLLMTAMKSPLAPVQYEYEERVFANVVNSMHPSVEYARYYKNPWLMHSIVNVGYRIKHPRQLLKLANDILEQYAIVSNDYLAALCVKAYCYLNEGVKAYEVEELIAQLDIDKIIDEDTRDEMAFRWKISLTFVKACLYKKIGCFDLAKDNFIKCANYDVRKFGIHLATKTTEAWFLAGEIAYIQNKFDEALNLWKQGVAYGEILLSVNLRDILINTDFPNRYHHGDGLHEYTLAWDSVTKCVNGIHAVLSHKDVGLIRLNMNGELRLIQQDLDFTRSELKARTRMFENLGRDLVDRTEELVQTRAVLVERTHMLEKASSDLIERTEELVKTREVLIERTHMLEKANSDLIERTEELVKTREVLIERTHMLEKANSDLIERTKELEETRKILDEKGG